MQTTEHIVITGLGIISPLGYGLKEYANSIYQAITDRNVENEIIPEIDLDTLPHGLTKRQIKKLDRFTILAMYAAQSALADAAWEDNTRHRLGLLIGNAFGGWSYVEEQMYPLCQNDMSAINSYVATAWFPAAPQGEISILNNISGISKTFSAGALSSAYAIEHGYDLIRTGILDAAIAGGAESPLNQVVYNSLIEAGTISTANEYMLVEAAGMLLLERETDALERGGNIYAKIASFAFGRVAEDAIAECLQNGGLTADQVDLLITTHELNTILLNSLHFTHLQGLSIGADFSLNVINACLLMTFNNQKTTFKTILVLGHSQENSFLCAALTRNQGTDHE